MRRESGLIIALDLTDDKKAFGIAKGTSKHCDAFKVNYPLVLSAGLGVVEDLSAYGPVICDFKVADIPDIDRLIVGLAFDRGADGVIVHGFPGEDSLKACVEVSAGDIFVVAAMSHPGAAKFIVPAAGDMALMAREAGASGIVAGATRPDIIARLRRVVGSMTILSPGIGPQGGDPVEAIRRGADYLIVGRRITAAKEPVHAAQEAAAEIRSAHESL